MREGITFTSEGLTQTDLAVQAYERASEPKGLVLIDGGHFDAYPGTGFERSSQPALQWFATHLRGGVPSGVA